ncbi:hypothetical protein APHAL10511_007786 [Amanita phalloides]|nr:hypothetical protein APHAL10511_007786 [Amanita phalloides]
MRLKTRPPKLPPAPIIPMTLPLFNGSMNGTIPNVKPHTAWMKKLKKTIKIIDVFKKLKLIKNTPSSNIPISNASIMETVRHEIRYQKL